MFNYSSIYLMSLLCFETSIISRFSPLSFYVLSYTVLGQVWYLIISIPDLCNLTYFVVGCRLVPHVDKAPLPLRILRLVTSNFLPVENPTHPTAHAPERASVYILGQFRTSK